MPRGARRLPDACVEVLARADVILHTGDFTAAAVLEELRAFAPVHAVRGNMDESPLSDTLPERLVVEAEGLRIGMVHDPGPAARRAARLRTWFPGCGVVAYGHTHLPEVVSDRGVWIVNPGSPTERRRAPAHTMAVIVGGAPELVTLA
jgi:putative phosphoesterase